MLGQGLNTLVLLTTNEEIARLHPAVVRPGRCLCLIEFERFNAAEADIFPNLLARVVHTVGVSVGPSEPK